ncbi:DUF1307 domain-containing protein [Glutamicibacter mishrai]|uniref:DUF1307 domain-containing protein n=1 Tax=Glutamicibacter mishrai TaxID=1775880 RepID=UPI0020CD62D9|nr:DUF1307 domain-containing protein [Glutamicibacter mishrai]UTT39953.1 DUF1307 domain-containing protein [Glutamicibacter mishrai]
MRVTRPSKKKRQLAIGTVVLLLGTTMLTGCGTEAVKMVTDQNGLKSEVVLIADGDRLVEQYTSNTIDFKQMGVTADAMKNEIYKYQQKATDAAGVEYRFAVSDDKALEYTEVKFAEADIAKLKELNVVQGELTGDETPEDVSLQKTINALTQIGFTKEQ